MMITTIDTSKRLNMKIKSGEKMTRIIAPQRLAPCLPISRLRRKKIALKANVAATNNVIPKREILN